MIRDETTGRLVSVPISDRFWPKVNMLGTCWTWTGYTNKHGYGLITVGRRKFYAHRISWTLHNGDIPGDMRVLHRCDNPPCVRPDHLFLGTQPENLADMRSKGRGRAARGERHRIARLTEAQVLEIRRRYVTGEKRTELMREFSLNARHLWMIGTGQIWKHLPMPAAELPHPPSP